MKQSTPNPFVLGLTILLGIAVGYVFYSQTSEDILPAPLPNNINDPAFLKLKDARLDFSLLSSSSFSTLKIFGEYPIKAGVTGKQDPFSP